jgi:hypothetical protein
MKRFAIVIAAFIFVTSLAVGIRPASTADTKVDFLFVIDNSPSMLDKQQALADAATEMATQLDGANIDWRIAVAYTDSGKPANSDATDTCNDGDGQPGRRRVCPFTTDINVFKDGAASCAYVKPGTCGDAIEKGFAGARAALLDFHGQGTGCATVAGGDCSLRPDARLAIVFVTDSGDQTPTGPPDHPNTNTLQAWEDYFASQNNGNQVQLHGIICKDLPTQGNNFTPCGDTLNDPAAFMRYTDIIAHFNGASGSILDTTAQDLHDTIQAIIDAPPPPPTTTTTTTLHNQTTTTTTSTVHATTTTTTTLLGVQTCNPNNPASCDDGDPCTVDSCHAGIGCMHPPVEGFESILCLFKRVGLRPAACGSEAVPNGVLSRLNKAQALVNKAESNSKKAKVFLTRAIKLLKRAGKITDRALHKNKISADCAKALKGLFTEVQAKAKLVKDNL